MMKMDADVVVTSLGALDVYYIKRSYIRKDIEYIYMCHHMTSMHMTGTKQEYDNYDTIMCVGPHQKAEIRAMEKAYHTQKKKVPEIDDEFAKDVSEFDTLAEFKDDLKQKIIDRNMAQSEARFRQALLGQLCDQVDIEIPEAMVNAQVDRLVRAMPPSGAAGHQPGDGTCSTWL